MKAVRYHQFGGPDVLEYLDVPAPEPGAGELMIRTASIGVNYPDIRERLGVYNQAETRVGGVRLPNVGGLAAAGEVVRVGDGADESLIGRTVVALMRGGAYAELAVAREALTVEVPGGADVSVLTGIAAQGVCAYLLLHESTRLVRGESLLVHGAAGGVGGLAVQIAKSIGAKPVIGTASTAARRDFVLGLGADAAISYDEPDWTRQVQDLTDGRGVDVLIESVGGEVFDQNFHALATFGRYLLLGSARGPGEPFAPRRLMTRSQSLIGFYLPVYYDRPDAVRHALRFLGAGLVDGSITSTVDRILPLSDAARAHELLESRSVQGVVVLDPTV